MQSLNNLPAPIGRQVFATLCALLPPPVIDTPEERAERDAAAIAAVAVLCPADAFEARLATQVIAADAHAMDCLRLAVQPDRQPEDVHRCRAQAALMMRQMQGVLRTLHRMQAARESAAAATCSAAQALGESRPVPVETPPQADIAAEADQYVIRHRKRAALIRSLGRLPDKLDFGPLRPALVRAIVTGTSPVLRSLDTTGLAA
jgi:hypothetical protein